MKIECNEESATAFGASVFFLCVACVAMFGCHQTTTTDNEKVKRDAEMAKAGLTQKLEPDHCIPVWTKP